MTKTKIKPIARIGLVVEGESDYAAVPILLRNCGVQPVFVLKFGGQPAQCNVAALVQSRLLKPVWVALLKKPDKLILVLDRESRGDCPGEFATLILAELAKQLAANHNYSGHPALSVVCADRKLENWLVADPSNVERHAYIEKRIASQVGNNADGKDGEAIIRRAYRQGRQYHKRKDAPALAKRVRTSLATVRARSRSLDKLLREAGC